MILQVPRELFPIRTEMLSPLVAVRLPTAEGLGALFAHHVDQLVKNASSYTPADAVGLAAIAVDLSAALHAHELENACSLPQATRRQALQAQKSEDPHHTSPADPRACGEDRSAMAWRSPMAG